MKKIECSALIAAGISWPWEWNWFGLFKNQNKAPFKKTTINYNSHFQPLVYAKEEPELPANIYIGAVELLAGALCMIVGTVIPPFYGAGGFLMGDGIRRIADGTVQLGEERRNDPNYVQPKFGQSYY